MKKNIRWAVIFLAVVLVCHLFETPTPEANALRYTYAHSGMIVAIASMIFGFTPILVTLKLNESVKIQEFHQRYSGEAELRAIRLVADVGRKWDRKERTQSHHDRPVYWNATLKSWVEQENANGEGV